MVYTKVVTNKSPWLAGAELGGVYCNPASHGEGRFVANDAWLHRLIANGQVATQYVDDKGNVTMESKRFLHGNRGHHQPGRPYPRQDGPLRETGRGSSGQYLRRTGYEDL